MSNNHLKRRVYIIYICQEQQFVKMCYLERHFAKNESQGQLPKMIYQEDKCSSFTSIFDASLVSLFFRLRDYLLTMSMSPSQLVQRHK